MSLYQVEFDRIVGDRRGTLTKTFLSTKDMVDAWPDMVAEFTDIIDGSQVLSINVKLLSQPGSE